MPRRRNPQFILPRFERNIEAILELSENGPCEGVLFPGGICAWEQPRKVARIGDSMKRAWIGVGATHENGVRAELGFGERIPIAVQNGTLPFGTHPALS